MAWEISTSLVTVNERGERAHERREEPRRHAAMQKKEMKHIRHVRIILSLHPCGPSDRKITP